MAKIKNKFNFKSAKKSLPYVYSGLICIAVLLIIYAVKGIFPFGSNNAAIMDMCHGYIPMYYHLYDFLHGDKSLFFDFYSGTGVNMVGIAAVNGLLSPFNLLFYLIPRSGLLQFTNILLILKIFSAAVTAQIFFIKRFKNLPIEYSTAFSFLYAFSGYVMLYYMHIIWLDVIILFPLLMYFGEKMIKGGKIYPYAICLALTLISSFYLGVMTLICVFFIGGAYIFTVIPKEKRGKASFSLGLGTFTGGLMPMFVLLPGYMQMSSSARYGLSGSFFSIINSSAELNIYKTLMFYGLQFAFVCVFLLFINYKKHKEKTKFAFLSTFFMFAPLVIEGSAAVIHFGSYKDFPYRFGFAAVFICLALAAEKLNTEEKEAVLTENNKKSSVLTLVTALLSVCAYCCSLVFAFKYFGNTLGNLSVDLTAVVSFLIITAVGCIMFVFIRRIDYQRVKKIAILVLCVLQMLPFALICIGSGSPIRYERREHDTEYITNTESISDKITADPSLLQRVHNPDMSLNINYGFVMGKSALSNWTHQIPKALQDTAKSLGYSTTYTLLLDGGGTVFSDSLLNMTQTVTKETMNEQLYSLIGKEGEFNIYDNICKLPVGMLGSEDIVTLELANPLQTGSTEVFNNQNKIFNALGGRGTLIRTNENDYTMILNKEADEKTVTYKLRADNNEVLYFTSLRCPWNGITVKVNGKEISVPSYKREDNTYYSAEYNNNCIELGVFDKTTVTVEISLQQDNIDTSDFAFGFLSLDRFDSLFDKHSGDVTKFSAVKNKISAAAVNNSDEDKYIFLPVAYDNGWKCTVNGEKTDVLCVVGNFCAVKVPVGQSEIKMKFTPGGIGAGIVLSVFGTAVFAFIVFIEVKNKKIRLIPFIEKFTQYIFTALFAIGVFAVYILPLLCSVAGIFIS